MAALHTILPSTPLRSLPLLVCLVAPGLPASVAAAEQSPEDCMAAFLETGADDLTLVKGIGERTVELNRSDIKVSAPKR